MPGDCLLINFCFAQNDYSFRQSVQLVREAKAFPGAAQMAERSVPERNSSVVAIVEQLFQRDLPVQSPVAD
jgi:hypothetical protein